MNWYDSYQKKMNLNGTSVKNQRIQNTVNFVKSTFFDAPEYNQVNKNFDNANLYHVWIYDGNKDDKVLGSFKDFISYPYDIIQFDIGDYLSFNYGGDIHDWLITSLDKTLYYRVKGRVERCNVHLKWKDDYGNIRDYPGVVQEKIQNNMFDFNNNIIINQGKISVVVQYNEYTRLIKINDRFLLGDPYQAFKVTALVNYTDTNTLGLEMIVDNMSPTDDTTNGIANANQYNYTIEIEQGDSLSQVVGFTTTLTANIKLNGEIVNDDETMILYQSSDESIVSVDSTGLITLLQEGNATITAYMEENSSVYDTITINVESVIDDVYEIIISPNISRIKQGQTQNFEVFLYRNGIKQLDTITSVVSGIPNNNVYYTFSTSDNNFIIKNIKMNSTPLIVTCTSGAYSETIQISLVGVW